MSGIPRSGSTVLAAILSQNPRVFVTPTSPLLDLLNHVEAAWPKIVQTGSWKDPQQKLNVSRGIIGSIYTHIPRSVIVDKHRAWIKNISGLKQVMGESPKILCTVRDLSEVTASYMRLILAAREKGQDNFVDSALRERGLRPSIENSVQIVLENTIEHLENIRNALNGDDRASIHVVHYNALLARPESVIEGIYDFLGLPPYFHEYDRIETLVDEDDRHWGLENLHRVQPKLKRYSDTAENLLGPEICARIREIDLRMGH